MTKRQRADFWKYEHLEELLAAHHIPDGSQVAAALDRLPPFRPIMLTGIDTRCDACDVVCQVGDTVFTCEGPGHLAPTLCYSCGIGWEIFKDRLTVDQAVTIPAVGGPSTQT